MKSRHLVITVLLFFLPLGCAWAGTPNVVVSIPPLHSLVAGVMQGVGNPTLLISGAASPHTYSLRPSDARTLQNAEVIFWVGEGLETFLERVLANLGERTVRVKMMEAKGIHLLRNRPAGEWEPLSSAEGHEEVHNEDGHHHSKFDPHIWLSPVNAQAVVATVAEVLSRRFPEHAPTFARNAEQLTQRLAGLDQTLVGELAAIRSKPYMVFHDGFQYFEDRYKLQAVGSVIVNPEQPPGGKRIVTIREKIKLAGVVCLFTEPQFQPQIAQTIIAGSRVRIGQLDLLGIKLARGEELYFQLLRGLVRDLTACLHER